MVIPPQLKDEILSLLVESGPYCNSALIEVKFNLDEEWVDIIMKYFERHGYVIYHRYDMVEVNVEAGDILRLGGFTFLETKYLCDLEKAKLELEKLQSKPELKDQIEQVSGITSIITNLITTFRALV